MGDEIIKLVTGVGTGVIAAIIMLMFNKYGQRILGWLNSVGNFKWILVAISSSIFGALAVGFIFIGTNISTQQPGNCFKGVSEHRKDFINKGQYDFFLDPSEEEPIVFNFKEKFEFIGAMKFFLFQNQNFEVEAIVDSECREIEEYEKFVDEDITERVKSPASLLNYDTLRIVFGDKAYTLRLGYDDDEKFIRVTFDSSS